MSGRRKRHEQRHFTFVTVIFSSHSPSFTISFSPLFHRESPFLKPVLEGRRDEKERGRQTIIVQYSQSFTVHSHCKQRDKSIRHSVSG